MCPVRKGSSLWFVMGSGLIHVPIFNLLEGLRVGLSRFSGPSRTALLIAKDIGDPLLVYDYQGLLRGHEEKLREIYATSDAWRNITVKTSSQSKTVVNRLPDVEVPGLINAGANSSSAFYYRWFTEHHPNSCSGGPTECWLGYAIPMLSYQLADLNWYSTGGEAQRRALESYAPEAVAYHIVRTLGRLRVKRITDVNRCVYAIAKLSTTLEEGSRPEGRLLFMSHHDLARRPLMVRFAENQAPDMDDPKHVRKMLTTVAGANRALISDGERVLGIGGDEISHGAIAVDFHGGRGEIRVGEEEICSFSDGEFHSWRLAPNLEPMKAILALFIPDKDARNHFLRIVSHVARRALNLRHGCTVALDLSPTPHHIPGQQLSAPLPLAEDAPLDLAASMARVDGAIHIDRQARLQAFGCLLDGRTVPGEERSRGARYNSALRFSADHHEFLPIVVSEDGLLSIFSDGRELTALKRFPLIEGVETSPPTLEEWLKMGHG